MDKVFNVQKVAPNLTVPRFVSHEFQDNLLREYQARPSRPNHPLHENFEISETRIFPHPASFFFELLLEFNLWHLWYPFGGPQAHSGASAKSDIVDTFGIGSTVFSGSDNMSIVDYNHDQNELVTWWPFNGGVPQVAKFSVRPRGTCFCEVTFTTEGCVHFLRRLAGLTQSTKSFWDKEFRFRISGAMNDLSNFGIQIRLGERIENIELYGMRKYGIFERADIYNGTKGRIKFLTDLKVGDILDGRGNIDDKITYAEITDGTGRSDVLGVRGAYKVLSIWVNDGDVVDRDQLFMQLEKIETK